MKPDDDLETWRDELLDLVADIRNDVRFLRTVVLILIVLWIVGFVGAAASLAASD